jgi:hypothetical protein
MMTAQISVNPNPFTTFLQIRIKHDQNENNHCIARLFDQKGNILRMVGITLMDGINRVSIERLHNLSSGNYYFDVKNTDGENIFSAKVVKE